MVISILCGRFGAGSPKSVFVVLVVTAGVIRGRTIAQDHCRNRIPHQRMWSRYGFVRIHPAHATIRASATDAGKRCIRAALSVIPPSPVPFILQLLHSHSRYVTRGETETKAKERSVGCMKTVSIKTQTTVSMSMTHGRSTARHLVIGRTTARHFVVGPLRPPAVRPIGHDESAN
jgi:hypothetical protein